MDIEYDPAKDTANRQKHGLPLLLAEALFAQSYIEIRDDRRDYGEDRFIAIGRVAGRLCICVFTWREGRRRIISLRKANRRECDAYHEADPEAAG